MSKRKYGDYNTLKEARASAREKAGNYRVISVYKEPDGSYSIENKFHKKAKLICGIDKSGQKYELKWVKDYIGRKVQQFIPVNKERKKLI